MIIIDRFEGDIAVVEYEGKNYNIPRAWLPVGAKEGDVVVVTLVVDEEATARRRMEMERKVEDLFE
jgi:hypothetical protein